MKKFDYIIVIAVIALSVYALIHVLKGDTVQLTPEVNIAEVKEVKELPDPWCSVNECKG